MTDEYSFGAPQGPNPGNNYDFIPPADIYLATRDSARNWPLILNSLRGDQLSFGAYTTDSRGLPRDQGFAQDWALAGAYVGADPGNPADFTLAEQLGGTATSPGLLTQTAASTGTSLTDINAVVIWIGTNNYIGGMLDYLHSDGTKDLFTPAAGSTVSPVNNTIETGIGQAVGAIQAESPGTKIVLVTTPDITQTPFGQAELTSSPTAAASLVPKFQASDAALTSDMTGFAKKYGLGLIDVNQLIQGMRQDPQLGDLTVDMSAAGPDPRDAWTGDGLHLGTPLQGRLSQAIVQSINQLDGSTVIAPLTDTELATYAQQTTPSVFLTIQVGSDPTTTALTATVATVPGAPGVPTGTITFAPYVAATSTSPAYLGTALGQVALSAGGTASLTVPTSALAAGPIVAVYGGDATYTYQMSVPQSVQAAPTLTTTTTTPTTATTTNPTSDPTSTTPAPTPTPIVAPTPIPTTVATQILASTPPIAIEPTATVVLTPTYATTKKGQTVELSIAVAGVGVVPDPSPAGTVTLLVGGRRLQYEAVVGGHAVATFPLAKLRGRVVTATYSGDGILPGATAASVRIAMKPPVHVASVHKADHSIHQPSLPTHKSTRPAPKPAVPTKSANHHH